MKHKDIEINSVKFKVKAIPIIEIEQLGELLAEGLGGIFPKEELTFIQLIHAVFANGAEFIAKIWPLVAKSEQPITADWIKKNITLPDLIEVAETFLLVNGITPEVRKKVWDKLSPFGRGLLKISTTSGPSS